MNEQPEQVSETPAEPAEPEAQVYKQDDLLETFVNTANRYGPLVGLTLFIKGTVISGRLIGGRQFLDKFAEQWGPGHESEDKDMLREALKQRANELYPEQKPESKEYRPPTYIHLEDARVFVPGVSGMPGNGLLWRGRLTEVDGWSLGALRFVPSSEEEQD